jgi:SAM-dependent methyltransferase
MQNSDQWKSSKFVMTDRGLRASRDPTKIGVGSRLIADLQAVLYDRLIREHARGVLLDLACGDVPLYATYRPLVEDNVCTDWSNTEHKSPFLDHEFDLNQGISLDDASFDTILITDVLEHIAAPDLLFREMARVLRSGGKIILTTPFLYWIHEAPFDYCRYTEYKLEKLCEENGLDVLSLEAYGGAPEVVLDVVAKQIDSSAVLSAMHLSFSQRFLRSRIGKRLSARSRKEFPLGYALVAAKP